MKPPRVENCTGPVGRRRAPAPGWLQGSRPGPRPEARAPPPLPPSPLSRPAPDYTILRTAWPRFARFRRARGLAATVQPEGGHSGASASSKRPQERPLKLLRAHMGFCFCCKNLKSEKMQISKSAWRPLKDPQTRQPDLDFLLS